MGEPAALTPRKETVCSAVQCSSVEMFPAMYTTVLSMRKKYVFLELSNVSAYQGTTEAAVTLLLVTKMLAKVKTRAFKKKELVKM